MADKTQQQTLSVRISDSLRRRLERARQLTASKTGEPVSTSEIAKQFLESARDDRLEVADLLAEPTDSLSQIRRKGEAGASLSRAEWTAPFDSGVVSGDLSQALGAPLERGQVLFEVATLDAYRVAIQVDERHIADLKVNQHGELVLSSMPSDHFQFVVTKITPVNTAREGRNFFRVEAQLESPAGARLRPGMEGVAKVSVDQRSLISIWTRELANWIRVKLWAWTP